MAPYDAIVSVEGIDSNLGEGIRFIKIQWKPYNPISH